MIAFKKWVKQSDRRLPPILWMPRPLVRQSPLGELGN